MSSTIPAASPPGQPVPSVPYGPAASEPVAGTDAIAIPTGRTVGKTVGKVLVRTLAVFLIRAIFRAVFRR